MYTNNETKALLSWHRFDSLLQTMFSYLQHCIIVKINETHYIFLLHIPGQLTLNGQA